MVKKNFCISGKEWTKEGIKNNSSDKMFNALRNIQNSMKDDFITLFKSIMKCIDNNEEEIIIIQNDQDINALFALRNIIESMENICGDLYEYIDLDNGNLKYEIKEDAQ